MTDSFKDIEKLEADLWEAADNLRANSKLTSSDYFMPVLGVIFLRHATNRFEAAHRQIQADQTAGRMPKRKIVPADYIARRALYLPEQARYDWLMQQATVHGSDLPGLVNEAMSAIEESFEPLKGVLPNDYGIFEAKVLEDLMRKFDSDLVRSATGDVFGRIYEYFLAKFSIQKAHDNGEFFTPSSLVQMIVNVIEPDHGVVFDPACGSGGMFVQSSHFIQAHKGDTAKQVVFYGQEKNRDTIRLAKMNLAVHGLEGKIAEAITYYTDEHTLHGKCDFVMANPPFNVDLVDAERVKGDRRLPFGLPAMLDLESADRLRPWLDRPREWGLVRTRGRTKGTEYQIEPSVLKRVGYRGPTSLKRIEFPRLRELILEDLKLHGWSARAEIHGRIGPEIPVARLRRALAEMSSEGLIEPQGIKRWRRYRIAQTAPKSPPRSLI